MNLLEKVQFIGKNLVRPECVLVDKNGTLHIADWRGGVTLITKNGDQQTILAKGNFQPKPNGIAIHPNGGWLLTHLGDDIGGVYRLYNNGELVPFLLEIDNEPLPPTNYVHIDHSGRIWITVSTRLIPRILGCKPNWKDGFIILIDEKKPRVVADNLGFTNECIVHPLSNQLYVNETFSRCMSKFDITSNGNLINQQIVAEFDVGEFPDGFAFDIDEGILVTCIVSNKLIHIDKNGKKKTILDDSNAKYISYVEKAYQKGILERKHLDNIVSTKLKNISSIAFGGSDLKNIYLGCLLGKQVATFKSKIRGLEPSHWKTKTILNKELLNV